MYILKKSTPYPTCFHTSSKSPFGEKPGVCNSSFVTQGKMTDTNDYNSFH